jgi:hypothetical protein
MNRFFGLIAYLTENTTLSTSDVTGNNGNIT